MKFTQKSNQIESTAIWKQEPHQSTPQIISINYQLTSN